MEDWKLKKNNNNYPLPKIATIVWEAPVEKTRNLRPGVQSVPHNLAQLYWPDLSERKDLKREAIRKFRQMKIVPLDRQMKNPGPKKDVTYFNYFHLSLETSLSDPQASCFSTIPTGYGPGEILWFSRTTNRSLRISLQHVHKIHRAARLCLYPPWFTPAFYWVVATVNLKKQNKTMQTMCPYGSALRENESMKPALPLKC